MDSIELTVLERLTEHTPGDVRLRVRVEVEGFVGLYDEVWVEEPVLARFLRDAWTLVQTYEGEAALEAMSPGEFALRLRALDGPDGWIHASGQLQRWTSGPRRPREQRLHFALDLPPGAVRGILQALVAAVAA